MFRKFSIALFVVFLPCQTAVADYISGTIGISGGYFPIGTSLTGDIDTSAETIAIDSTQIWGAPYVTIVAEYLNPGTYTRTFNIPSGGSLTRSATIPAGTIGAYFVVEFNNDEYYQIYNAWTVDGSGMIFTNQQIAGDVWIGGNYNGRRAIYEFSITPPPPPPPATIDVEITMNAGPSFQCSEVGGHTVTGINATITENDGAVLDFVQWELDGVIIGVGLNTTEFAPSGIFLSLGSHTIKATAFAVGGRTNSSSENVQVNDTVAPTLEIQFLDMLGNPVTTASVGDYQVHYITSDVCDDDVSVSGTATPVLEVFEGDIIGIVSNNDIQLPTTAIRVSATATDNSGRVGSAIGVLNIQ